jgi:Fe-S-cluster containining protein
MQFTLDGKCSNCGRCCSNVLPVSNHEIKVIKAYMKKHHITEACFPENDVHIRTCPFRDNEKKRCVIYLVRPVICQVYQCDKCPQNGIKRKLSVVDMAQTFFKEATNG